MTSREQYGLDRRSLLKGAGAAGLGLAATGLPTRWAIAQDKPLKVGLMLPYTGTFAKLGENITDAISLYIGEKGGKLGGRAIEIVKLDDESEPSKAPQNADRLVKRDGVDVLIGTVHSGVQMGITKVVRESGTLTIIPNAGLNEATRELCAPNIFRSSFTNWQPAYGMGKALAARGLKKAAWITWDYGAGAQSGEGFAQGFATGGGKVVETLKLPFPQTNFQPLLAKVPGLDVEVVGAFFAGGGAIQFVKDYKAANLKPPLCGSGFLTEGVLAAQGPAAEGIETALHYGDDLDLPRDKAFRKAFQDNFNREPDVYAVQGYDAAQLLAAGLEAVKGDVKNTSALYKAMASATLDSPRGKVALSKSQNATQNIYLRKVTNGRNRVVGIAAEALADPGTGCTL
jgi:branched-chain amino acid transport system substrate-binding protein